MNATKAGRPQKNRVRFGPSTNAKFFDRGGQLFVAIDNGQATKHMSHGKGTAAMKTAFPAAYRTYQAAGGAL
jgi:hypothetical protein